MPQFNLIDPGEVRLEGADLTKIVPPRLRSTRVSRPRLIERFGPESLEDVVIVMAPAGYGKTTLLAEWAERQIGAVAWVSLEEGDNDAGVFWRNLGAALIASRSGATQHGVGALAAISEIPIEYALGPLLGELSSATIQTTIFLDDFQVIGSSRVNESVSFLLDHLPQGLRVVFGTRSDPAFRTSRLRAQGRLLEIRANGLAFNEVEAADLIRSGSRISVPIEDVKRIVKQTEGWAMGLRAAAFALTHKSRPDAEQLQVEGASGQMPGFLRREIFNKQPEAVRQFLVKTSILDHLNPDLCDFMLKATNGARILAQLDRADVFISALDESQTWFRVHPLLQSVLRSLLAEEDPEDVRSLHCRASAWLADHGQLDASIRHALDGEDWANAVARIAKLGAYMVPSNRSEMFKTWLSRVPHEHLVLEPYACVQLARTMMFGNLHSDFEGLLRISDSNAEESGDPLLHAAICSVRTHAECFRGNQDLAIRLAQAGLDQLPKDESLNRGLLYQVQSVSLMLADRVTEAEAASILSFEHSVSGGNAHTACLALGMRGFINLRRGRLNDAYRYVARAEGLVRSSGLRGLYILPFHRSRVDLESLKIAESAEALREAEEAFELTGYRIFMSSVHLNQARLKWMQGDYELAEEFLRISEGAERSIGGIQDVFTAQSLRVRMALERGDWSTVEAHLRGFSPPNSIEPRMTWLRARCALAIEFGNRVSARELVDELTSLAREAERTDLGTDAAACYAAVAAFELQLGSEQAALATLEVAVRIAASGRLFAPFWEHRSALLALLQRRQGGPNHSSFVAELLHRLNAQTTEAESISSSLLSSKELEILLLLSQGHSNDEIARRTSVSQNTVKTHLQHIYLKLQATNRTQAVASARALKVIP